MKLDYAPTATRSLEKANARIRKAFYKEAAFLLQDLHHPSLHAKKYSESEDLWQARVNARLALLLQDLGRCVPDRRDQETPQEIIRGCSRYPPIRPTTIPLSVPPALPS